MSTYADHETRSVVEAARREGGPLPPLRLLGGDLHRTLGGAREGVRSAEAASRFACDLGSVLADGRIHWFVAHLVAKRSWLGGQVLLAMNAAFLGSWNVAPRGHPGDGLLEILEVSGSAAERLKAWPRLRSGSHLPHQGIRTSRTRAFSLTLPSPTPVILDGRRAAVARNLMIRVEPEALEIYV